MTKRIKNVWKKGENVMVHIIMDLLTVALIGIFAFLGFRKGFFRSLVNTIGSLLLYFAAYFASKIVSPILYTKYLGPYFVEKINLYVTNVGEGVRIQSVVINALSKIPTFCKNKLLADTNIEDFVVEVVTKAENKVNAVADIMVYEYIPKVLIPLMQGILFILLILLLFFLLRSLILLLGNHVSKRSLIGKIDGILGAVCGAALGFILLLVIGFAVELVIGFSSDGLSFCSTTVIGQSYLFKWIYKIVEAGLVITVG